MLLKMMHQVTPEPHQSQGFKIIEGVQEISFFYHETGEAALSVQYSSVNRGLDAEEFIVRGPVYLMSNEGKTIETFHPSSVTLEKRIANGG